MGLTAGPDAEPLVPRRGAFPGKFSGVSLGAGSSLLCLRLISLGPSCFKFLPILWPCQLLSKLEGTTQTPGCGAPAVAFSPLTLPFARAWINSSWTVVNRLRSEFFAVLMVLFCHSLVLMLSFGKKGTFYMGQYESAVPQSSPNTK